MGAQDINNGDKVLADEAGYINPKDKTVSNGLSISGGGIRSASFGLGIMQSLVANDKLKKMDYMSTVSGGGFLGSALTWALKQGGNKVGTEPDNFPLGKRGAGGRLKDKGNELLDFIRQHGNYLMPTSGLGTVSFAAIILRSMLLSLFVYLSFLTVLMVLLTWGGFLEVGSTNVIYGITIPWGFKGSLIPIGLILLTVYLVLSFTYSIRTFFGSGSGVLQEYLGFCRGQKVAGFLWMAGLTCLLIGSLPYFFPMLSKVEKMMVASGSTLFGSLVGAWQYMKAQNNDKSSGVMSNSVIYLGAFALLYGLLLLAFILGNDYFLNIWLFSVLAILSFVFGVLVNLNLISPHRVWRDRLMEAYMPNRSAIDDNIWEPATKADGALMEDMCDEHNKKPYHIVNTNLILVDSDQAKFRNRGGDNFIISRLFSGSDATGWTPTNKFQNKGIRGITLATAMATSAAALNPNAGVSGEGATKNSVVSVLLAVLNLRLGYWTINPRKNPLPFPPNFFFPGLSSEITRSGLSENRTDIQLSDGGHFENLALYELIRRKLKVIVLCDGGADAKFNFDDLANAVEKVRVDFNAKIAFTKDFGLDNLLPKSAEGNDGFIDKYDFAKKGFAIADITYHDGSKGSLIYLKLTVIEGLPTDVLSYKGVYPSFPHQSTSDQFFDEKQFEAYRELGYYVGWQMMESEPGKKLLG